MTLLVSGTWPSCYSSCTPLCDGDAEVTTYLSLVNTGLEFPFCPPSRHPQSGLLSTLSHLQHIITFYIKQETSRGDDPLKSTNLQHEYCNSAHRLFG